MKVVKSSDMTLCKSIPTSNMTSRDRTEFYYQIICLCYFVLLL